MAQPLLNSFYHSASDSLVCGHHRIQISSKDYDEICFGKNFWLGISTQQFYIQNFQSEIILIYVLKVPSIGSIS